VTRHSVPVTTQPYTGILLAPRQNEILPGDGTQQKICLAANPTFSQLFEDYELQISCVFSVIRCHYLSH